MDEMILFYTTNFDMKVKFTLTFRQVYEKLNEDFDGIIPDELKPAAEEMLKKADKPWLTYLEYAPGQFLEFFYQYDIKQPQPDLSVFYGYQHFSLEVDDIHSTLDRLKANGVEPDSPLRFGAEGTWQCWLHDPDGNRFEIMEYTEKSLQVTG
jgi:catechol 2,3-dioxygenase-like lactoylglutathione lyase family enzyme